MRNLKLTLEYDGTAFHGFQRQNGLRTVQGEVEARLSRLLDESVKVIGAGRTDAGVHALGQVANFRTTRPIDMRRATQVLNATLPQDVKVQACEEVADAFHARRCARSRTYQYTLIERGTPSPLLGRFAFLLPYQIDVDRMQAAAEPLVGQHDFKAFQASGSPTRTTERTVRLLQCRRSDDTVRIIVEANSFLYRMVRIIVAALVAVGRRDLQPEALVASLSSGERLAKIAPAPACGLCLLRVLY
jgi:tRNA pseudouridine38-40 synthase